MRKRKKKEKKDRGVTQYIKRVCEREQEDGDMRRKESSTHTDRSKRTCRYADTYTDELK